MRELIAHAPHKSLLQEKLDELRKTNPEVTEQESDSVDHPAHYNDLPAVCQACGNQIECIDVVRHLDFDLGNTVKYIWRAGKKDPKTEIQDLEKALWYLQDRINQLKTGRQ